MSVFRPKHPHGVLLVAAGAVAGSIATLAVEHWVGSMASAAQVSSVDRAAGGDRPAMRSYNPKEESLKLGQILAADDREHKSEDLRRLGQNAAEHSPADALGLASGIRSDTDRADFIRGVVETMAEKDPKGAAEFSLNQFSKGSLQAEALRIAMSRWGAADPRGAYAWSEEHLSGPVKEEAINSLVQSWASRSPREAARWFEETGSTSQPLLGALLSGWAGKAPKEAAQWVETLPNASNRDTGRILAAREWAAQNPQEAADFYKQPAPDLAGVLADIWGTNKPAEAAKWISQLPAGASREEAAGTLATVWAASDINAAAQWSASLRDTAVRGAAVEHLAATWGAIDPDKAVQWIASQPAELKDRGYIGAYNSWAGTDPVGLADWITRLPAGAEGDIARRSLAEVKMAEDPASALNLALSMTPQSQPETAGRYFRVWQRDDAAAAQDWLDANWNALPQPVQQRIEKDFR